MKIDELKVELKEMENEFDEISSFRGAIRERRVGEDYTKWNVLKTEIEYLKKGIEACEEIQDKLNISETNHKIAEDVIKQLEQALSQRNQEILEWAIRNSRGKVDINFYDLKKQLTNSEEDKK